MKQKIASLLAIIILRVIRLTCRYELQFENESDKEFIKTNKFIMAFFHQHEIALIPYFNNRNIGVLVSLSKDGQIMNNIATHFGYSVVRGSSSKGAVKGLISAIRYVKTGESFAMAVDGPRGPIYKVKDGVCAISNKTEVPIMPVSVHYSSAKTSEKSWNKAKLPLPFSKITLRVGAIKSYNREDLEAKLIKNN